MCALTVWIASNQFAQKIKYQTGEGKRKHVSVWEILYEDYRQLKLLTELVNNVVGSQLTFYLLGTIVYYAITFDQLISGALLFESHWSRVFLLIFNVGGVCGVLLVSADVCRQVKYNISQYIYIP